MYPIPKESENEEKREGKQPMIKESEEGSSHTDSDYHVSAEESGSFEETTQKSLDLPSPSRQERVVVETTEALGEPTTLSSGEMTPRGRVLDDVFASLSNFDISFH